jgi:dihydrolipoamide dehydrogenase
MIVILGGGPAGRTAAMRLALAGKDVALVEKGGIGGQCLHYGCMVVCALNDAARTIASSKNLHKLGILDDIPSIRFPQLLREMRNVQERIESVLDTETRTTGVDMHYGKEGRLQDGKVFIGDECVEAEAVIAATGSRPKIPDIPGKNLLNVFNPHTLTDMDPLPDRLVIIGGGVMAAEFAYIFNQFGCDVHLLSRSGLLKNLDPSLRALALKELAGVHIHEDCAVGGINGETHAESVTIGRDSPAEIPCDAVFIAAGLVPRSEKLQGLKTGKNGRIIVDRHMRTSRAGIYACGDVTGSPCLTPVARREGIVAADNILGRETVMDYHAIPRSLNLFSELAYWEGDEPGGVVFSVPGPAGPGTFWSVPGGNTGLARVAVDPDSKRLDAVYTAGPSAGIIAAYTAFLSRCGIHVDDLENFLEVHPMSDGVYSLLKYASYRLWNKGLE